MKKIKLIFLTILISFSFSFQTNSKPVPASFADLAEKLMPSVVNISTSTTVVTKNNPLPFLNNCGKEVWSAAVTAMSCKNHSELYNLKKRFIRIRSNYRLADLVNKGIDSGITSMDLEILEEAMLIKKASKVEIQTISELLLNVLSPFLNSINVDAKFFASTMDFLCKPK